MTIKKDILASLSYFDIFYYPLTEGEIFQFLGNTHSYKSFEIALKELCAEHWVYHFNGFYCLQNQPSLIERRRQGNQRADKVLKTAQKVAAFLSYFPFVRGIAISGSLSKHFADESSDIDFFVITKQNKLWIARTIMLCFRRIAILFGKEDWFCLNYYIDEQKLEIEEKNIFTAIEIATLIPCTGPATFENFYGKNSWHRKYLPNCPLPTFQGKDKKESMIKKVIEAFLNNSLGDFLDQFLMRATTKRWNQKKARGEVNKKGFLMSIDTSRHFVKPDASIFQQKILNGYKKRIDNILFLIEQKQKHPQTG